MSDWVLLMVAIVICVMSIMYGVSTYRALDAELKNILTELEEVSEMDRKDFDL